MRCKPLLPAAAAAAAAVAWLMLAFCAHSAASQELSDTAAVTAASAKPPEVQAAPTDTTLSLARVGSKRQLRIVAPGVKVVKERTLTLQKLPQQMKATTMQQMKAMYKGAFAPKAHLGGSQTVQPQANGLAGASFSDSRFTADYYTLAKYRVGTLFVRFKYQWYICSASVINRALLVTAAHCVCTFGLGQDCLPDLEDGSYQVLFDMGRERTDFEITGNWTGAGIMVPSSWAYGTDGTDGVEVPANNDMALVWLNPSSEGVQVGNVGGWFAYGTNGYGFSAPLLSQGYGLPTAPASAMLTQLGYPFAFDQSGFMQISQAATYNAQLSNGWVKQNAKTKIKNIIRGTAMTGGSSGGPWVANYGIDALLYGSANYGQNADRNVIMGVTSWGFKEPDILAQGASFFGTNQQYPASNYGTRGAGNIGKLMYDACDNPALTEWNLQAKELCV